MRDYIDELEAKSLEVNLATQEMKEWIQWGRVRANWYDPNVNAKDELLDNVDKPLLASQCLRGINSCRFHGLETYRKECNEDHSQACENKYDRINGYPVRKCLQPPAH